MGTRELIMQADSIAREQGFNQSTWSTAAGRAGNGQTVSRILSHGDCRLSTLMELLRPLGYEMRLVRVKDERI